MPYKQSNNPIYRKTSPLRDKGNHPHPHNKPGVISIESPETARTSVHPESEHHPKLEGQPMPAGGPYGQDYEHISDMEESGVDQPDYESDDYKPGVSRKSSSPVNAKCPEGWKINPDPNAKKPCIKIRGAENPAGPKKGEEALSRKSSSPLNKHDEWQKKIDEAKAKDGDNPDFYEVYQHLYKGQEKARLAHKEEKPKEKDKAISRKSSSPLNEIKPENRGKFTKWAQARGMTAAQAASKVMGDTGKYSSEVVKMANFAKNAQSW